MDEIKLRTWIQDFKNDRFGGYDRHTQIEAGWYDWFCKDSSLRNKTYRMGSIIKQIKDGGKINLDESYVFFKNNCPVNGPLYDDFRICNIETGDVQFTICINACWYDKRYTVFGRTPDGTFHSEEPLFETDSSRELVKWLNTAWEE